MATKSKGIVSLSIQFLTSKASLATCVPRDGCVDLFVLFARVAAPTAYIGRVPGIVGGVMVRTVAGLSKPYALEVVGDPSAAMQTLAMPKSLAQALSSFGGRQLRRQCKRADGVAYVTSRTLQRLYPPRLDAITASYSSVELPDSAFRARSSPERVSDPPVVVVVATMSQRYKGHDVLLKAIALVHSEGVPLRARLVGSGRFRSEFEGLADSLCLRSSVDFVGQLTTPDQVQAELDAADLFAMPSRTEGLPRALLEAMARGIPCVASRVGGIPELLGDDALVTPGDPAALAGRMLAVLRNPHLRVAMSSRNFEWAQTFHRDLLSDIRNAFYAQVGNISAGSQSPLRSNGEQNLE